MNTSTTAERTGSNNDELTIRQLLEERELAMRARDAARLVSHYAPEIVLFSLAPPLRHAGPDVLNPDGLRRWFSGFDGAIEYEIRDLMVTADGDVAFCHSLNRLSATPRGTHEKFDLWFRATVCLRKIEGEWRIAHEHTSTPFYMDGTFGAAVDLKP